MKHLLITLPILLLSSPLYGQSQETNVLYRWKTSSGFQWETFGNGEVKPKYVGEITNGEPDGNGTLTYSNGDKYEGEWKDGKEHGQGTWTWSNGQKDVGEFRGDKHWNTTNYDKNGNILGKWVNGEWIKN